MLRYLTFIFLNYIFLPSLAQGKQYLGIHIYCAANILSLACFEEGKEAAAKGFYINLINTSIVKWL